MASTLLALSVDVQNIGRWGVDFQDDPGRNVPWYNSDGTGELGAHGYIAWMNSQGALLDTPIFWDTWRMSTLAATPSEWIERNQAVNRAEDNHHWYSQVRHNHPIWDDQCFILATKGRRFSSELASFLVDLL